MGGSGGGISPGLSDGGELGDLGGVQRRDGGSACWTRCSLRRRRRGRGRVRGGRGGAKAPLREQSVGRRETRLRELRARAAMGGGGEDSSPQGWRDAAEHRLPWKKAAAAAEFGVADAAVMLLQSGSRKWPKGSTRWEYLDRRIAGWTALILSFVVQKRTGDAKPSNRTCELN